MGLFSAKKPTKEELAQEEAIATTEAVFDEQFREELRQVGREHFQEILNRSSVDLKEDIDSTMQQVAQDLKEYMTRQMDVTISRLHDQLTDQLNERINEYSRLSVEAQDQANQSFNRNTQMIQEKYQQLSTNLQQAITSQEVAMITVFQENKSRIAAVQSEQEHVLRDLSESAQMSRQQSHQLGQAMQKNITDQAAILSNIYQENISRSVEARNAQASALSTLSESTDALQQQHQKLGQMLDDMLAKQKDLLSTTLNDNMSRIIEHYLIGALGEQSDVRSQLPAILERLQENKQAMMDDMNL